MVWLRYCSKLFFKNKVGLEKPKLWSKSDLLCSFFIFLGKLFLPELKQRREITTPLEKDPQHVGTKTLGRVSLICPI